MIVVRSPAGRRLASGLVLFLVAVLASGSTAATDAIWTGQTLSGFNGGFAVVPATTPGLAYVLVGTRESYPSSRHRVLVFRAGPGFDANHDFLLAEVGYTYERTFGSDLAAVGDVDGDGHDDFVICSPVYQSIDEGSIGSAFHFYRGGAALDGVPDLTVEMFAGTYTLLFRGVCGGGDFNGDGYDDFVLSAHRDGVPAALVWFGGPGLDGTPDMEIPGVVIRTGRDTRSLFADLNGDGIDDLVANAADDDNNGLINVYFGAASPASTPAVVLDGGWLAGSLGAGDTNGDGYDDLVVATGDSLAVFHGGPSFDTVADASFRGDPDRFELHLQNRIRVLRDADRASGARVFANSSFGRNILSFDDGASGTAVPDYVFPPDGSELSHSGTAIFAAAPDLDQDGADELAVLDEAYRVHIYRNLFFDCNGNGQPDNDEVAGGLLPDCDGNGLHDACEVIVWPDLDCNGDLVPDACQLDSLDCNGNGQVDACELVGYPWLDCNGDGVLDECGPVSSFYDCDADGVPDCRQIHDQPSLDCTGDGTLDACQYEPPYADCNANGTADFCEIAVYPARDCNGDAVLDACQVELPGFDCNRNGQLDTCEGNAEKAVDCDRDGRSDLCQVTADRSSDCDASGFPDACEAAPPRSPCLVPPRLAVYFDADLTVTNLPAAAPQTVGDMYIALQGVEPARAAQLHAFAFSLVVPAGVVILDGGTFPGTGVDLSGAASDWFVVLADPFDVGPDGEAVLVHCQYFVQADPGPDARLVLRGSAGSPVSTLWPTFEDAGSGLNRVLDVRSAWFGLTFADCDDNGVDDADDLAAGRLTDLNGDQIPDQCQGLSSAPVPAAELTLAPPAPNPFNPMTTIGFTLPSPTRVLMTVHDAAGRRVSVLVDGELPAGTHEGVWRGRTTAGTAAASGVYFVRLKAGAEVLTRKIALLR
ncbi:MAG: FlgD immunoglobulin-like domain containing protein [Candidatus Krumholzibacteriia bacterium]